MGDPMTKQINPLLLLLVTVLTAGRAAAAQPARPAADRAVVRLNS